MRLSEELTTNKPRPVVGRGRDLQRFKPVPADDAEKGNGLEEIGHELAHLLKEQRRDERRIAPLEISVDLI